MMASQDPRSLLDVVSAPLGDLIAEVGRSVAHAQEALDEAALDSLERIYAEDRELSAALRALGYRPTWYHIPSAEAELQVALRLSGEVTRRAGDLRRGLRMYAAPVDAGFQNTYDYDVSASSRVRFTVVPIPEPGQLEGRDVVPQVEGSTLTEAGALLDRLGIAYSIATVADATDLVAEIRPEPGSLLDPGQGVVLVPGTAT